MAFNQALQRALCLRAWMKNGQTFSLSEIYENTKEDFRTSSYDQYQEMIKLDASLAINFHQFKLDSVRLSSSEYIVVLDFGKPGAIRTEADSITLSSTLNLHRVSKVYDKKKQKDRIEYWSELKRNGQLPQGISDTIYIHNYKTSVKPSIDKQPHNIPTGRYRYSLPSGGKWLFFESPHGLWPEVVASFRKELFKHSISDQVQFKSVSDISLDANRHTSVSQRLNLAQLAGKTKKEHSIKTFEVRKNRIEIQWSKKEEETTPL
ncbi:hypothetical protein [Fulvitalea axinellae]